MRVLFGTSLISCILSLASCGGGAASSEQGTTGGGIPVESAAMTEAEAQAQGGSAELGAPCDYGGADRYTCGASHQCCYGALATPEGFGTCRPQCEE